jgi:hypothetical protein
MPAEDEPETIVVVEVVRPVLVAVGRARILGIVVPRTATQHCRSVFPASWIREGATFRIYSALVATSDGACR